MNVDVLSAIVRALSFIAMLQAAGMAIFLALFGSPAFHAASRIRSIAMMSAVAGMLFVSLHYVLEAARMAGELAGMLDSSLQRLVLSSSVSAMAGLRIFGLALILVALNLRRGRLMPGALLGALLGASCIVTSFTLVGHTAQALHARWLGALLVVHLAVVAFWFGSLLPLILVDRLESREVSAAVVEQFSRLALWIVPTLFLAGLILMIVLVDGVAGLFTEYGFLLLAKIGAFAVLMSLAALNRWRLGPALATQASASRAFQRAVWIEYVLIIGVLAATAVLTTFFSPESSTGL